MEERFATDEEVGSSSLSRGTIGVESRGATPDLGSGGGGFDSHYPDQSLFIMEHVAERKGALKNEVKCLRKEESD